MEIIIWQPVGVVNALIFFVIDVPALWAIHRGLLALQGWYLFLMASSGRDVAIARSRNLIVAGELLRGVSRLPSIFVRANIAVLLCVFGATLGVDGDMRQDWERASFRNITTFSMPSNPDSDLVGNGVDIFYSLGRYSMVRVLNQRLRQVVVQDK